jgi:N-acetylglucosamine malate deacetylase 1
MEALKSSVRRILVLGARVVFRLRSEPYRILAQPMLVIAPHPDDETLGCGALIARKRKAGHRVGILFLTDGSASHRSEPGVAAEALVLIREAEARAAAAQLGVAGDSIRFLRSRDGELPRLAPAERARLVAAITAAVRETGAREVFLPCCPDGSSEHDVVMGLVQEAVTALPQPPRLWEYPVWTWRQPRVLWSKLAGSQRVVRAPAAEFREDKRRALQQYRSQVEPAGTARRPVLPPEVSAACLADPEYFMTR